MTSLRDFEVIDAIASDLGTRIGVIINSNHYYEPGKRSGADAWPLIQFEPHYNAIYTPYNSGRYQVIMECVLEVAMNGTNRIADVSKWMFKVISKIRASRAALSAAGTLSQMIIRKTELIPLTAMENMAAGKITIATEYLIDEATPGTA